MAESGNRVSRASITSYFGSLPKEGTRGYEVGIQKLVMDNGYTKGFTGALTSILSDKAEGDTPRYAAFFALCALYRRSKSFTLAAKLFSDYGADFSGHITYPQQRGVHFAEDPSETSLEAALQELKVAMKAMPDNSGVLNTFSRIVATAAERGYQFVSKEDRSASWDLIDKAIRLDPYPEYYSIKGRLAAALNDEYEDGRRFVRQAIDLEKPDEPDFAIRLGEYQSNLIEIDFMEKSRQIEASNMEIQESMKGALSRIEQQSHSLDSQTQETRSSLDKIQGEQILVLGFFAALLTFVFASVQILSHEAFGQAMVLTPVLGLTTLVALYGFAGVVHPPEKGHSLPFAFSITLLILLSLLLFFFFRPSG